jgi:hypothetical protein
MHDFQLPPETNSRQDSNILIVKKGLAVEIKPLSLGNFQINNH